MSNASTLKRTTDFGSSQNARVSAAISSSIINEVYSITNNSSSNGARNNNNNNNNNSSSSSNAVDKHSIQNLPVDSSVGGAKANDSFFKTAINTEERVVPRSVPIPNKNVLSISDVRLPITVNVVALRETLFVEAPFVNKKNKSFWRKMLDSKHFSTILSAAYNFISVCITESGNVLMDKLNDIQNSPLIEMIAATVTDMFYTFKRLDRDLFFRYVHRAPNPVLTCAVSSPRIDFVRSLCVYDPIPCHLIHGYHCYFY